MLTILLSDSANPIFMVMQKYCLERVRPEFVYVLKIIALSAAR